MRHIIKLTTLIVLISACNNVIKNDDAKVIVEEGTNTDTNKELQDSSLIDTEVIGLTSSINIDNKTYWVGFFKPHRNINLKGKYIAADEGLYWGRNNKISISIDTIINDSVIGNSVVAGNHRPFNGNYKECENGFEYEVKEPGDDKYDGVFKFKIIENELIGVWDAYKTIDIPKREYRLSLKTYKYDSNIMLNKHNRYGDWNKFANEKSSVEVYNEGTPDEEIYEWIQREYASSTDKIYEINASTTLLTKDDVENLTSSDLLVIRNTIYARHGYSFKNRPLRVFFDSQDWYIPVHADIKQDFTEIELKNIQLLLKYEKNAKEYYDYFGRG
jgi:hypothetical protein